MNIDFFRQVFQENEDKPAIIWKDKSYCYKTLLHNLKLMRDIIDTNNTRSGMVVGLRGDYSPFTIALLLALIEKSCIIVPLHKNQKEDHGKLLSIAQVQQIYSFDENDAYTFNNLSSLPQNEYYETLVKRESPGLVLFTSGTSGEPKAAVHDFDLLLEKFKEKKTALRTLNFLLFDHWGGLNTMFHILANGGVVIATAKRNPDFVCALIEKHQIELLPASPTFLNLMLLSGAYETYNLDSLKIISYGTEPMPETTLRRLTEAFPNVKLLQTYGLIELGVLKSKSERNDSLWVKVGGDGYQTRIVDDILQIKAKSAMLGYLNAPSPFTPDGWFITGDEVLQKGEYIKILGRKSEIINVGGEKVYPQEIENIIMEIDFVNDVTVFGEKNPLVGNIVCARVLVKDTISKREIIARIKKYCSERLQSYKVPVKVKLVTTDQHGSRYKKLRS